MITEFYNIDPPQSGEGLAGIRQEMLDRYPGGTGWVTLPVDMTAEYMEQVQKIAEEVAGKCRYFVVVGIGGSYLGARAVIDVLNGSRAGRPQVVFAGYNMTAAHLARVIDIMHENSTCLCVISKSGGTLEPLLAYSILKDEMYKKYGIAAKDRIFVVTGAKGKLRDDADREGYICLDIPENIGGRYSVLSVVGLLPIAVAGFNIAELLSGARSVMAESRCLEYASARVALQNSGKSVEIFTYFDTNCRFFGEWLKQLFGETEGKDGKGAYPACLCYSRDLHSVGQFMQQGNQIFSETMVQSEQPITDIRVPEDAGELYAGKYLEDINRCSEAGVVRAHSEAGIPIVVVRVPRMDEFYLGQLIYFFEMSAAISAMLLGVNPFDQPGVEAYKIETKKLVEEL